MAKKRTRVSKVRAEAKRSRATEGAGFKVSFGAIEASKVKVRKGTTTKSELKYFQSDLTKVLTLTMLALALEIALWLYLPR